MMLTKLLVASCYISATVAFVPTPGRNSVPRTRLWGKLDPLATEGAWSAYLDEDNTGLVYYFNTKTGESLWEPPTDTFPAVKMDREQRKIARTKRAEYREAQGESKKGFFSSLMEKKEGEKVEEKVVEEKKEQDNWFDGLFDKKPETIETVKVEKKAEKKADAKKDGFFPSMFSRGKEEDASKGPAKASAKMETKKAEADQDVKNDGFFSSIFSKGTEKDTSKGPTGDDRDQALFETSSFSATRASKAKRKIEPTVAPSGFVPVEIEVASVVLPHPAKVSWGGEDAVFVKGRSFGVFDGVSGADKLDGIPLFSVTLADEMKRMLNEEGATIKEIVKNLADASDFANRAATGASTALVASIGKDGFLRVLNIGDSVCMVVRNNKIVTKTKEIVHYFDCPYQLSEESPDRAQDGTKLNFEVVPGDVVLMGSDGVFDNLSDDTIVEVVSASQPRSSVIAKRIVDLSRKVSLDQNAETPYAKLAKRNGFEDFANGVGGKVDDVSCIVVRCT